jgi:hypothetical protein
MTMKEKLKCLLILIFAVFTTASGQLTPSMRRTLVTRSNIVNSAVSSKRPLTVGNGEFYFTTDITGLQTFPDLYRVSTPLKTIAEWNWFPEADLKSPGATQLCTIGLYIEKDNGKAINSGDIMDPVQYLDLWTGEIDSRFKIEKLPVHIKTVCHPGYDMISVKIVSKLLAAKRIRIQLTFPDTQSPAFHYFNLPSEDPVRILSDTNNVVIFTVKGIRNNYTLLTWKNNAMLKKSSPNLYYLEPEREDSVYSFSCQFLNNPENGRVQNFGETEAASKKNWGNYWKNISGSDFCLSAGCQGFNVEQNQILSQYFTKIEVGSELVPAESGITYNRWFGKYHLGMHWWLSVQ